MKKLGQSTLFRLIGIALPAGGIALLVAFVFFGVAQTNSQPTGTGNPILGKLDEIEAKIEKAKVFQGVAGPAGGCAHFNPSGVCVEPVTVPITASPANGDLSVSNGFALVFAENLCDGVAPNRPFKLTGELDVRNLERGETVVVFVYKTISPGDAPFTHLLKTFKLTGPFPPGGPATPPGFPLPTDNPNVSETLGMIELDEVYATCPVPPLPGQQWGISITIAQLGGFTRMFEFEFHLTPA